MRAVAEPQPRPRPGAVPVAVLLVALALAAAGRAHAGQAGVTISADSMQVDAVTRVATAVGRVRISDGLTTASAERATLYHGEGRGVLSDRAKVVTPQGALAASEIAVRFTASEIVRVYASGSATLEVEGGVVSAAAILIVPREETARATGGVSYSTRGGLVATGRSLTYDRRGGAAALEGQALIRVPEGTVGGERIEARRHLEQGAVTGGAHGRFGDIEIQARSAEFSLNEQKVVFLGEVVVKQPGRRMTTEKVTIWYAERRLLAEGLTRVTLESQP